MPTNAHAMIENLTTLIDNLSTGRQERIESIDQKVSHLAEGADFISLPEKIKRFTIIREVLLNYQTWLPDADYNIGILTSILEENWERGQNKEGYELLANAWDLSKRYYEGKFRKAERFAEGHLLAEGPFPYIKHPLEVAILIASLGYSPKAAAISLLHDIIELSGDKEAAYEDIKNACSEEIANMVNSISENPILSRFPKTLSKSSFSTSMAQRALKDDPLLIPIKSADRYLNLLTVGEKGDSQGLFRQASETIKIYQPMLAPVDTELADATSIVLEKMMLESPTLRLVSPFRTSILDDLIKYAKLRGGRKRIDFLTSFKSACDAELPALSEYEATMSENMGKNVFPNKKIDCITSLSNFSRSLDYDEKTGKIIRRYFGDIDIVTSVNKFEYAIAGYRFIPAFDSGELLQGPVLSRHAECFSPKREFLLEEIVPYFQIKIKAKEFEDVMGIMRNRLYSTQAFGIASTDVNTVRMMYDMILGPLDRWRLYCLENPGFPSSSPSAVEYLKKLDPVFVYFYFKEVERQPTSEISKRYFNSVSEIMGRKVIAGDLQFTGFMEFFRDEMKEMPQRGKHHEMVDYAKSNIKNVLAMPERFPVTNFIYYNEEYFRLRTGSSKNYFMTYPKNEFPANPFVMVDFVLEK